LTVWLLKLRSLDEDKANREKIEARNSFELYTFSLKNQVNDKDGLGGKISEEDKETLLEAIKEATEWLEQNGSTALAADFEEQKEKLNNIAYPITSKIYDSGSSGPGTPEEPPVHDDL